ncbi:hypothetical protein J4G37_23715 [Microvirga sp. 3-52]|nr:hypothetical protein [Microvirga sp. 3-52]
MREAAVRLFHQTLDHRAGPPLAPPSINLTAQGSQALGLRVLALGQETIVHPQTSSHPPTSWPALCRPPRSCEAQRFRESGSPAQGR